MNDGIHLLDIPAEGTVYRFTPWATSITPLQQDLARVWYHPGSESIKVSLTHPGTPVSVTVYDNQGRKLQEMECVNPLTTISDQSRAPGIYLLKLATATGKTYFKKLLIP